MKAMILAAGLGTRLKPLTDSKPKALVEVDGKPLLEHLIHKLILNDFKDIVINIHHFADQVVQFVKSKSFAAEIRFSDESKQLLDTGGGIINARSLLEDGNPFIVHNVDIVSDINLRDLYTRHLNDPCLATLVVSQRESKRAFLFNQEMRLGGWKNFETEKEIIINKSETLYPYSFAGIHVVDPKLFDVVNREGSFSIVDSYLELSSDYIIKGINCSSNRIIDVGKPENLKDVEKYLSS